MKTIKIIKFIAIGLGVIGPVGFGLNLVSCGQKQNHNNSWTKFKAAVNKETAINIVNVTKPTGWGDAAADQLKIENIKTIDLTQEATLDIHFTKNKDIGFSLASFVIDYVDDEKYNVSSWTCSHQPQFVNSDWTKFKNLALASKAQDLLTAAHPWTDKNKYKWEFGTSAEATWASTDKAEFDTFGNVDNSDAYKGMQGQVKVDDNAKTITAIISKEGKNGAYDSNPIKADLTFKAGQVYNVNDWVFTKDVQLQSYNKFLTFWNIAVKQVTDTKDDNQGLATFLESNWMTLGKDTTGNAHPAGGIIKILNENTYDNLKNIQLNDTPADPTFIPGDNKPEYQFKIAIKFYYAGHDDLSILSLYFNFILANKKDKIGGGTAFNYVWWGDVHPV